MLDNKDASDLNLGQGANRFKYRRSARGGNRKSNLIARLCPLFFIIRTRSWIFWKSIGDRNSLAIDGLLDLVTKLAKTLKDTQVHAATGLSSRCQAIGVLIQQYGLPIQIPLSTNFPDICDTFDMLSKLLGEDITTKPYIRHFSLKPSPF
ncbi:hypothetical protein BCR42DRAFT_497426 [Absidia repens]|uniref:Uncharacterized protein n=1 Tax=Absidia repens TaxID=90262 RepID=A0A1X2H991_9FUNG|nr:hypothetical protein BCR42DRAFT_497426 [Absidia repens]